MALVFNAGGGYLPQQPKTPEESGIVDGGNGYYNDPGFNINVSAGLPYREGSKVCVKASGSAYSSYHLKAISVWGEGGSGGGSYGSPKTNQNGVTNSFSNVKISWENPGPFESHKVKASVKHQQLHGGTSTGTATYNTGTLTTAMSVGITFDPNGGSMLDEQKNAAIYYGDQYEDLPTPKRPGYKFTGWYTESINGALVKNEDACLFTSDITLYAQWELQTVFRLVQNGRMAMANQAFIRENNETKQAISLYIRENSVTRQGV